MSLTDRCVWIVSSCSRHQSSSPSVLAASLSNSSSDSHNKHSQLMCMATWIWSSRHQLHRMPKPNYTHTQPFKGPFPGLSGWASTKKGKTNLDFTEARDSEWQWHQLGRKSAPRSILITMPAPHHSVFLQAGCPSCCPTNSVKALSKPNYCCKIS